NLLLTGTPNSLSQLSGEGTTAAQNTAFASGSMFNEMLLDQGTFWRNGETADSNGVTFRAEPLAYAAEKKKPGSSAFKALKEPPPPPYQPRTWRLWTGGFGGGEQLSGAAFIGTGECSRAARRGPPGAGYCG